jgi:hypothetical protein
LLRISLVFNGSTDKDDPGIIHKKYSAGKLYRYEAATSPDNAFLKFAKFKSTQRLVLVWLSSTF